SNLDSGAAVTGPASAADGNTLGSLLNPNNSAGSLQARQTANATGQQAALRNASIDQLYKKGYLTDKAWMALKQLNADLLNQAAKRARSSPSSPTRQDPMPPPEPLSTPEFSVASSPAEIRLRQVPALAGSANNANSANNR